MRKITKTLAVVLSLSMTLTMGTPVFAEGTADSSTTVTTVVEAPVVTPTPAQENKPPKTGFYKKAGKTYYYKNGKLVKNKYGYKIKNKYYHINKKGVVTTASTAEKLAAIRLKKCGGNLKKAFTWSSTKIKYFGGVKKPGKSKNAVEYYAAYGFKYGKGDCYVMAATFAMMAKVKGLNVKFVMGSVPQRNGKDGEHARLNPAKPLMYMIRTLHIHTAITQMSTVDTNSNTVPRELTNIMKKEQKSASDFL